MNPEKQNFNSEPNNLGKDEEEAKKHGRFVNKELDAKIQMLRAKLGLNVDRIKVKSMNNPENKKEISEEMNTDNVEEAVGLSEEQLIEGGWEEVFSFHRNITEEWIMACEKVKSLRASGFYDVILVNPDDEKFRKDNVQLLMRRKKQS